MACAFPPWVEGDRGGHGHWAGARGSRQHAAGACRLSGTTLPAC